ncbi:MAG: NfeD family protein [Polyangiaceae bacterium]|nr:NfeD family protein [Polyangiaceae bacterium]
MGIVYLIALGLGGGVLALQALGSGEGDHGGEPGHAGELGHADQLGHGHGDAPGSHEGLLAGGFLASLLSLRFWAYALAAFGMVGTPLHYFGLAGPALTLALASAMALFAGGAAVLLFRALARAATTSGAEAGDAVGQVGRVRIALGKDRRGKVRVEVKGQTQDWIATTDDEALEEGETVLVEEVRGEAVHVSRAPLELRERER